MKWVASKIGKSLVTLLQSIQVRESRRVCVGGVCAEVKR
jgi:hypothetical protein